MRLRGIVASPDGSRAVKAAATGAQDDPVALGFQLADRLLTMGADSILAALGPQVRSGS